MWSRQHGVMTRRHVASRRRQLRETRPVLRSGPAFEHRQGAWSVRHDDRGRADDAAVRLHESVGFGLDRYFPGVRSKGMTGGTHAQIALPERLQSGEEAEQRPSCPDDDHVEQAVVGLDLSPRLDQRPHLSEVGDEDLGGLGGAAGSVQGDLVLDVADVTVTEERARLVGGEFAIRAGRPGRHDDPGHGAGPTGPSSPGHNERRRLRRAAVAFRCECPA